MNRLYNIFFYILRAVAVFVVVAVVFVAIVIALEMSDAKRFKHYCTYPTLEMLMEVEPAVAKSIKMVEFEGNTYTMINLGPMGFLPSGSAYLVYDANGRLVDRTSDEGDDSRFQRKWGKCKSMNCPL